MCFEVNELLELDMFKFIRQTTLYLLVLSTFSSCGENYFTIGDSWVSRDFKVVMIDTVTIELSTVKIDSLRTQVQNTILAGRYLDVNPHISNDTITGLTTASSYLTLSIPQSFEPDHTARFDSLVIEMRFNGAYFGDTISQQNIQIYRTTRRIEFEEGHAGYNTTVFPTESTPLGEAFFKNLPTTNTSYTSITAGNNLIPPVRIRLPDALGLELLQKFVEKDEAVSDNDKFSKYFNALMLTPGRNSKAINGFKTDSTFRMRLYYHVQEEFKTEKYADFLLNTSLLFNNINSDRSGTPLHFPPNTNELHSSATGRRAYIQSGDGMYAKLSFPSINNLLALGKYGSIERALLIIRPVATTYGYFTPLPRNLYLYPEYSSGTALTDSYNQSMNGNLTVDYQFGENTYYSYDITSFLRSQLGAYDNYKYYLSLRLSDTDFQSTMQRVVIGDRHHLVDIDNDTGAQTFYNRVELQIFYTIYNDPTE